jgi:hypothetical protein
MLLTINTPKDSTQDIPNSNNTKLMTLEEVSDNIVELLIEGADSVCINISNLCFVFFLNRLLCWK